MPNPNNSLLKQLSIVSKAKKEMASGYRSYAFKEIQIIIDAN